MQPSYEAICENDCLEWTGDAPIAGRAKVRVTVLETLDSETPASPVQATDALLERTKGSLHPQLTPEELEDE